MLPRLREIRADDLYLLTIAGRTKDPFGTTVSAPGRCESNICIFLMRPKDQNPRAYLLLYNPLSIPDLCMPYRLPLETAVMGSLCPISES